MYISIKLWMVLYQFCWEVWEFNRVRYLSCRCKPYVEVMQNCDTCSFVSILIKFWKVIFEVDFVVWLYHLHFFLLIYIMLLAGKKGGALASALYSYMQHGNPEIRFLVQHTLTMVWSKTCAYTLSIDMYMYYEIAENICKAMQHIYELFSSKFGGI